jgi:hypothetical protein
MDVAPTEFFTWTNLGSLTGASAAVIVVTNAIQKAAQRIFAWLPLLASLVITLGTAWYAAELSALPGWGLAFLNGCLLYCTATGANESLVQVSKGQAPGAHVHGAKPTGLISSWLR